jgi:hypothetical protein
VRVRACVCGYMHVRISSGISKNNNY